MQEQRFFNRPWKLATIFVTTGIVVIGALVNRRVVLNPSPPAADNPLDAIEVQEALGNIVQVTALGWLVPEGETIQLSAPNANQRLRQWLVQEGEAVQTGQSIAVMDGLERSQADVDHAKAKVDVSEARLAQVQAGENPGRVEAQQQKITELQAQLTGDVAVQQVVIARHQVELEKATVEYERFRQLLEAGGTSASQVEEKLFQRDIAQEQLYEAQSTLERIVNTGEKRIAEAQATLTSLAEVQPVDVRVAAAEVQEAISALRQAEVALEELYVKSPINGQILSYNTQIGEIVGSQGLATLGQTQQMYVIAEVYESDIRHVAVGQRATIISEYGGFL
ncbi:MAG: HlyD family efflux transporter periplasmic adaptor subunit, partial [Cyanothece sp. SIO2G6]|nr:HlyD family efflux transporter periplasmic adaptor subunit [Cyanothece sp. SIO2G6]